MKFFQIGIRTIIISAAALISGCTLGAQSRSLVIQGATLIDGTGRAALADSVIVIRDGKFQAVGKRGEVSIPQGAEVIDAKGKTVLPGLIDGHCHYRDWMGEIYLAYGVRHLPEYFQQSGGMDHRAARRGEKRQRARAARVGVREHHRRAAARRHRRAQAPAHQHHRR